VKSTSIVLIVIVVIIGLSDLALVAVMLSRPNMNVAPLTIFISSLVTPTVFALLAYLKSSRSLGQAEATHDLVSSKLDESIKTVSDISISKGRREGEEEIEARIEGILIERRKEREDENDSVIEAVDDDELSEENQV
jgi:hypothetical protein